MDMAVVLAHYWTTSKFGYQSPFDRHVIPGMREEAHPYQASHSPLFVPAQQQNHLPAWVEHEEYESRLMGDVMRGGTGRTPGATPPPRG